MKQKLNTNVLVIGKSGVGKSSLLNYIFDRKIEDTGSGHPITKKGIYPHEYSYDKDFNITIYDTWGLEPDRNDEWEKLILDEVHKHEKSTVKDWFNTIIFCISKSSKFEDFEISIAKKLISERNHILFVITHSESANDLEAIALRDTIVKETGVSQQDVVMVCSVEKQLLGSSQKVLKFGKEQIIISIIRNLWRTFKKKIPYVVNKKLDEHYEQRAERLHRLVDKQRFMFRRTKKLKEFEDEVNGELEDFIKNVSENINKYFISTIRYYNSLTNKYVSLGNLINDKQFRANPNMKYNIIKYFEKEVEEKIMDIQKSNSWMLTILDKQVNGLIKELGVVIKEYISSTKELRKALHNHIDEHLDYTRDIINKKIMDIERQIDAIDIEMICERQLMSMQ